MKATNGLSSGKQESYVSTLEFNQVAQAINQDFSLQASPSTAAQTLALNIKSTPISPATVTVHIHNDSGYDLAGKYFNIHFAPLTQSSAFETDLTHCDATAPTCTVQLPYELGKTQSYQVVLGDLTNGEHTMGIYSISNFNLFFLNKNPINKKNINNRLLFTLKNLLICTLPRLYASMRALRTH